MPSPIELHVPAVDRRPSVRGLAIAIAGLGLMGLLGYGVFLLFATGGGTIELWGTFTVAVVAGVASFFSPCSFPLLPGYLGYYTRAVRDRPARSALVQGLSAAGGVAAFGILLAGVLAVAGFGVAASLSLVGAAPSPTTQVLRFAVGGIWLALGVVQLRNINFHRLLDRVVARAGKPVGSLFAYGFGYTLAGIGCTAPFLAAVGVVALAAGGFVEAIGAVAVFILTMAALMIGISWVTATSANRLKGWAAGTPKIKTVGGVILVIVGAATIAFTALPQLLRPLFP